MAASLRILLTSASLAAIGGGSGGATSISLSGTRAVIEGTASGVTIGTLSVNEPGTWVITVDPANDAGDRVAVTANVLKTTSTAFNYDTATFHDLKFTATRAADGKSITQTIRLSVIDAVTLVAVTMANITKDTTLADGSTLWALGAKVAGETRTLSPNDGRWVFNADQSAVVKGIGAWGTGATEVTVVQTHAAATNSPITTKATITVAIPSVAPVLQPITWSVGNRTPKETGSVFLKNLGLLAPGSSPVASWTITFGSATGGGAAGDWTLFPTDAVNSNARLPRVVKGDFSDLTTITLVGTYVFNVQGKGLDGSLSNIVQITVQTVPNAWNIGDDNIAFGTNPDHLDGLRARFATDTGGLTALISTGADFSAVPEFFLQGFVPAGATRMAVRYADPTRPSPIGGLVVRNCSRVDLYGLVFGAWSHGKIIIESQSGGVCTDCTVDGAVTVGTSFATIHAADPKTRAGVTFTGPVTDCRVTGVAFEWVGRAVVMAGGATRCSLTNSTFRYHYGDAASFGTTTDCVVEGVAFISPMRYPGDIDHIDGIQFSDDLTITRPTVKNCVWIPADGNAGAIGMNNGATMVEAPTLRSLLFLGRASRFWYMGAMNNADIQDITYFHTMSGKIAQSTPSESDNVYPLVPDLIQIGGTGANVIQRMYTTGKIVDLGSSYTRTNVVAQNVEYTDIHQFPVGGPGSDHTPYFDGIGGKTQTFNFAGILKHANAFERSNNYDATLNPAGFDYPSKTVAEIVAHALDVATPAVGGTLDLGGGVSVSAVGFNGLLKPVVPAVPVITETTVEMLTTEVKALGPIIEALPIPAGNNTTVSNPTGSPLEVRYIA